MSQSPSKPSSSYTPHIILASIVLIMVLLVVFWPSPPKTPKPTPAQQVEVTPKPPQARDIAPPTRAPITQAEATEPDAPAPEPEAAIIEQETAPAPPPLDTRDSTVKTALLKLANYELLARLLVNDDLLRRFVVLTSNLADNQLAPNHQVLTPPQGSFQTYQQAGKEWLDPSSFKRYTPYAEALVSIDSDALVTLYQKYQPAINEIYAEIGQPQQDFSQVLHRALEQLIATPDLQMPQQVYTDSVMFKYSDPTLEALSPMQKQLLRTGPDNMRRIKAKLRELQNKL